MNLLPLILSILVYFVIHSILATKATKNLMSNLFHGKYYRLFYNFVALIGLIPIAYFFLKTEHNFFFDSKISMIIGSLLVGFGLFFMKKAMKNYDTEEFAGTAQLKTGHEKIIGDLNISGMNAYVRHPLYFAGLLIIWGVFMIFPTDTILVFSGITTVYIRVGSSLEEQKLVSDFGNSYQAYQKEVPMLIPAFFKRKKA